MDLGQIIYIIAIIVYFIYQASKKKKALEPMESDENKTELPEKGFTFEELLKEIRNAQNPQEQEKQKEVTVEPIKPVPVSFEQKEPKNQPNKRFENVEDIDEEASFYEGAFRSPIKPNPYQALANKKFSEPEITAFKSYEIQSKKINPYADLLKNPKSLKESIIVSEILRPKYF